MLGSFAPSSMETSRAAVSEEQAEVTVVARSNEPSGSGQYTSDSFQPPAFGLQLAEERIAMETLGPIYKELLSERGLLVTRELRGELKPDEARRLAMIRWQIDQYESAQLGPDLRHMSAQADAFETLARSVSAVVDALDERFPTAVRPRGR